MRCVPAALVTPPGPAGIEIVSVAEGTRGAVATNERVVGVRSSQVPATGGVSVGVGVCRARGVENSTDTVASLGTAVVPPAGVTDVTVRGLTGVAAPPDRVTEVAGPEPCAIAATPTPRATRATTAMARRQIACPPGLRSEVAWACFDCISIRSSHPNDVVAFSQATSRTAGSIADPAHVRPATPPGGRRPPRRSSVRGARSPERRRAFRRPRAGRRTRRRLRCRRSRPSPISRRARTRRRPG